ncbi:C-terminal binding protein, partial [Mesorhizobium sp. M2C.T.Ca.TU.002.02.1.1]
MKILCANWQAADEAELEREHYPDIEFILARSTNDKAAALDPA